MFFSEAPVFRPGRSSCSGDCIGNQVFDVVATGLTMLLAAARLRRHSVEGAFRDCVEESPDLLERDGVFVFGIQFCDDIVC